MNVIIPCSGLGTRFLNAGFTSSKPLIDLDDKKIIDYVIKMFNKNDKFIFICNEYNYDLLKEYVEIKYSYNCIFLKINHNKKGPVKAILDSLDDIKNHLNCNEGISISYCDYFQEFNYDTFLDYVNNLDGCVVSYSGYHPHLIPEKNIYASSLIDENNNILQIFEKKFIGNKQSAYHSCGLYYFKNISIIEKYFNELVEKDINVNGEFYVSLVYNLMIEDGLKVKSFNDTQAFLQLGTPEDFNKVKYEHERIKELKNHSKEFDNFDHITLMAGRSKRFKDAGYPVQKAFMEINDQKIYLLQQKFLPSCKKHFITAEDYKNLVVEDGDYEYSFIKPNNIGPAFSYFSGNISHIKNKTLITSCDVLCNYFTEEFIKVHNNYDIIVFATQGHPTSLENPCSFSWISHNNNDVNYISLKEPISIKSLNDDYMLIGSFYVKNNENFLQIIDEFLKMKNIKCKEYYIDEVINLCINKGLKVGTTLVDGYYSFGTPEEYLESAYWLNYFKI